MRPAQIRVGTQPSPLLGVIFQRGAVSWDERSWCHSKPPWLARPRGVQTSDSAWLTGWVSGDPIPLVSCTSDLVV